MQACPSGRSLRAGPLSPILNAEFGFLPQRNSRGRPGLPWAVVLSFDETFRDICLALSEKQRRGKRDVTLDFLVKPLEEEIRGKVSLEGGRFYVTGADGSIEAHLLSEGWRKLAGEVFRTRPPGL